MGSQIFLQPIEILDGWYTGTWSGHTLKFDYNETCVQCETKRGVRGLNVRVGFDIRDGKVVESTIEQLKLKPNNLAMKVDLEQVAEELRQYRLALRNRENGNLAAGRLADALCDLFPEHADVQSTEEGGK